MRFENVFYLYLTLLVPFIFLLLVIAVRKSRREVLKLVSPSFYMELVKGSSRNKNIFKILLFCCSLVLLLSALARPQFGKHVEEAYVSGINIVVVFDVSASMLCEDIKPSRLSKAKHTVERFVDLLGGDRVGLVAFSGSAVLVSPLTTDHGSFKMYLQELDTKFLSSVGTALAKGVEQGIEAIQRSTDGEGTNVILLITDGEDHEGEVNRVLELAKGINARIFVIGAATESGAPVPNYDFMGRKLGYKKQKNGEIVISRLNTGLLSKIALETGGKMYFSTHSEKEADSIIEDIHGFEAKKFKEKSIVRYRERYRWPLVPAFMLMFIGVLL
ncbi:MAG: VWA domain-containing protein [Oligoflexia bacterium]|nr:VWA domain-containing protein [Oligoflexia bacterium]